MKESVPIVLSFAVAFFLLVSCADLFDVIPPVPAIAVEAPPPPIVLSGPTHVAAPRPVYHDEFEVPPTVFVTPSPPQPLDKPE